ncbi:putative squalene monooxygenase [Rosa chinensis]|uniref:Squalene monooxygenase n=1 Tax=Rosa chinensis TaxID=74649 RepID=A0A2P6QXK4_ROSCH|nr:putative squalene monooxygenase [Rosa chinensis]
MLQQKLHRRSRSKIDFSRCSSRNFTIGADPKSIAIFVVVLFLHFFAIAIYGVGRLMLPFPSPKRMWLGFRLILSASGIIFPIIKGEGVRQMFFPATVPAYYRSLPVH